MNNLQVPPSCSGERMMDHSPGISSRIKVPRKQYVRERDDSLERMETPMFDKAATRDIKKGPSSAATVLTMAGLFVCGILLIASGILVLIVHSRKNEDAFIITGCIFLGVGLAMLFVCAILQRKNIVKFVLDLNRDLYFLNMSNSYMWRLMFEMRTDLPLAND